MILAISSVCSCFTSSELYRDEKAMVSPQAWPDPDDQVGVVFT